jgi:hypothetical protein
MIIGVAMAVRRGAAAWGGVGGVAARGGGGAGGVAVRVVWRCGVARRRGMAWVARAVWAARVLGTRGCTAAHRLDGL